MTTARTQAEDPRPGPGPGRKMNGRSREHPSLKLWQQKDSLIDRNRFHLLSFGHESPIL